MENNFTSQEHSRDASGNVVLENTGRTIARMRERQRGRNFVNGVIITALALSTVVTGILLGASNRYANNLRAELASVQQQMQSQNYSGNSSNMNGTNGMNRTSGMSGTSNYGSGLSTYGDNSGTGSMGGTMGSSYNSGTNTSGSGYGNYGSRYGSGRRNWRNYNNTSIAPATLPTSGGLSGSNGTGSSGYGSSGYGSSGYGSSMGSGSGSSTGSTGSSSYGSSY
jgi:hypothetical protein